MYNYQTERPKLFTKEGQTMLLKVLKNAQRILPVAGCARMDKLIQGLTGDSWMMLACVDRLVELGELCEVTQAVEPSGQYRIFFNSIMSA